jgi:hypothetical protein
VRFEPTIAASERAKTVHALDRSATVTGSCSASQKINRLLWNRNVYCYAHKGPPMVPNLIQINPNHKIILNLFNIHSICDKVFQMISFLTERTYPHLLLIKAYANEPSTEQHIPCLRKVNHCMFTVQHFETMHTVSRSVTPTSQGRHLC